MDFELTEDQQALQEGMRNFCTGRFPMNVVRGLADVGGIDRDRWRELADMGTFALALPEAEGGAGLGVADAVLVFEELGRALVPGPVVWTHLSSGFVAGAATGDVVVGGMERTDPSQVVEFVDRLDLVLVLDDEGAWTVPATELLQGASPLTPLDPLTPVARLDVEVPQGNRVLDGEGAARLRLLGAALVAAQLLGIAEATIDLAVAYAKQRVQFDRPIGSFQALKHLMADMVARTEVARGAVYAAGVTLDDPAVGDAERAVAAAKLTAGEAALANAKTCIQVHGGMGYTWEVDAHLYFKRAYALEPCFGSRDAWAERMAELLDASV
ncbi:MAG: acyl-CoA/acyl-ACP dehydrogenase [Acidimicrobiales bacterium]|nr:acyl-CoA/acyl-ACP dehydrogenase [Acidimicrobiales bacterium]